MSRHLTLASAAGFLAGLLLTFAIRAPGGGTGDRRATGAVGLAGAVEPAGPSPAARQFGYDAGLVLNFVRPERTSDFEAVVARIRQGLLASDKPERRLQAGGWKVFKAVRPAADGSVLYVFSIDPAVNRADYAVRSILTEAFPAEGEDLYRRFIDACIVGREFVDLMQVSGLGQ